MHRSDATAAAPGMPVTGSVCPRLTVQLLVVAVAGVLLLACVHFGRRAQPVGAGVEARGTSLHAPSGTSRPDRVELVGRTGGATLGIAALPSGALVGVGASVHRVRAEGSGSPALGASAPVDDVVSDIALVTEGVAYAAAGGDGVRVLRLGEEAGLEASTGLRGIGEAWRVAASGDRGLAATLDDAGEKVLVMDLSDPERPRAAGTVEPETGEVWAIAVVGGRALLADGVGVDLISVSVADAPETTGRYEPEGTATDVAFDGVHAYVVYETDTAWALQVVTVTAEADLLPAGRLPLGGRRWGAAIEGDRLALLGPDGLTVVDVSDPMLPLVSGTYDTPEPPFAVDLVGRTAYVATEASELHVVDLASPGRPTAVGILAFSGSPSDLALVPGGLVTAQGVYGTGLWCFDLQPDGAPVARGHLDTPGQSWRVASSASTVLVADWSGGLRVVDASDPGAPRELGSIALAGPAWDLAADGEIAYVAAGEAGLGVIDLSVPQAPREMGGLASAGRPALGVAAAPRLAFVAGLASVDVVDRTDPAKPELRATVPASAPVGGMQADAGLLYVADGAGLQILDVGRPAEPVVVGRLGIQGGANDVAVADGLAYLATDDAILVVDLADPSAPRERARASPVPGLARRIALADRSIWVAAYEAGLLAYRYEPGTTTPLPVIYLPYLHR